VVREGTPSLTVVHDGESPNENDGAGRRSLLDERRNSPYVRHCGSWSTIRPVAKPVGGRRYLRDCCRQNWYPPADGRDTSFAGKPDLATETAREWWQFAFDEYLEAKAALGYA
jgi:hypothetical protein